MNDIYDRLKVTRPSFLEGITSLFQFDMSDKRSARQIDIIGTDPRQADIDALRSDWEAVGRDMWSVLGDK